MSGLDIADYNAACSHHSVESAMVAFHFLASAGFLTNSLGKVYGQLVALHLHVPKICVESRQRLVKDEHIMRLTCISLLTSSSLDNLDTSICVNPVCSASCIFPL